ncbi:hypothetical protein [Amycolatopsis samaneae]|uniref:Uncharacterized protein n=1 Tax=Amycolatopsis samaneae TaxID=664691 RepID=A0ABW5GH05_9PSEU
MNMSEDELEQRLRTLFADDRLGVMPGASAEETIVAGARRRRRRRRVVMSASGVTMAALVAVGGFTAVKIHGSQSTAALSPGSPELSTQAPAPSTPGSPAPATSSPPPTPAAPPDPGPTQHEETPPRATGSRAATTTPSKPQTTKVTTGPLLTASGIGALKLGMTEAQVTAQGMKLGKKTTTDACSFANVQGGGLPTTVNVTISQANGVVAVTPTAAAHTPEGIGAGSSKEDVIKSYAGASEEPDGLVAPAGQVANYHFTLTPEGDVASVNLASVYQDC